MTSRFRPVSFIAAAALLQLMGCGRDPEVEVNARAAPALELPGGTVLRFDGRRTADSSYFAEPPTATLAGRHEQVHGRLRASICRRAEGVCRTVTLEL
jgi:hypothetical protein